MSKKVRFLVFDLNSNMIVPLYYFHFESDAMSMCYRLHSESDMCTCIYDTVLMRYFFYL